MPEERLGEMPIQVVVDGIRMWQFPSGKCFPVIGGGAEGEGDSGSGSDSDGGDAGDDGETFDKERAMATIKKLRESEKAAKAQAKELDQIKAKLKEYDDAKLGEVEKATKAATEAQEKVTRAEGLLRDKTTKYEVMLAAEHRRKPP